MSARKNIGEHDVFAIKHGARLQWEDAQQAWLLLYPEGMVKLSESAAEILKRVDASASVNEMLQSLSDAYPGADLRADVIELLETAYERGWIERRR
jgi:pyrroloquinoline quinone biosynthesis protein D